MVELDKGFDVFRIDDNTEQFLRLDFGELKEILDSNQIMIIVNHLDKLVWIWQGKNSNIRMKVIATQEAPKIRDMYGIDYKISAVDEGIETEKFKSIFDLG